MNTYILLDVQNMITALRLQVRRICANLIPPTFSIRTRRDISFETHAKTPPAATISGAPLAMFIRKSCSISKHFPLLPTRPIAAPSCPLGQSALGVHLSLVAFDHLPQILLGCASWGNTPRAQVGSPLATMPAPPLLFSRTFSRRARQRLLAKGWAQRRRRNSPPDHPGRIVPVQSAIANSPNRCYQEQHRFNFAGGMSDSMYWRRLPRSAAKSIERAAYGVRARVGPFRGLSGAAGLGRPWALY